MNATYPVVRPILEKIMPELPLSDVPAGVAHYRDVLGFSVNYQQHDIGVMDRNAVACTGCRGRAGSISTP